MGLTHLASFPELARWERAFGSLIRGARASLVAARDAGPMFLRPLGGVSRLPRAGAWMVWVKRLFAFIMLGVAEYYLIEMGKLLI